MIRVYHWKGASITSILGQKLTTGEFPEVGHVSMEVFGGLPGGTEYISWWPGSRNKERSFIYGGFQAVPSYSAEQSDQYEERPADSYIDIVGLDESKMKAWWRKRKGSADSRYSVTESSCATTVFIALVAGGSYQFTPWYYPDNYTLFTNAPPDPESHNYPTFTPGDVFAYAKTVQAGSRAAAKRKKGQQGHFAIVKRMKDPQTARLVNAALSDNGRISFSEVKTICKELARENGLEPSEIDDLKKLVTLSRSMDQESKRYIHTFIKSNSKR